MSLSTKRIAPYQIKPPAGDLQSDRASLRRPEKLGVGSALDRLGNSIDGILQSNRFPTFLKPQLRRRLRTISLKIASRRKNKASVEDRQGDQISGEIEEAEDDTQKSPRRSPRERDRRNPGK